MDSIIDINNRKQIRTLLLKLNTEIVPFWGKMTPRQMVEHLLGQVEYSNGKYAAECRNPEAEADKQRWIYTGERIPKNVVLGSPPAEYLYPDLQTATAQLLAALDDFDLYFKDPGVMAVHGGFGPMDHGEWLIWHGKHFTHHFTQFGLIT